MSDIPKNCDSCGFFFNGGEIHCTNEDASPHLVIEDVNELPYLCPIKEDVLDTKRFRVKYRGEDFYLCVAEFEGKAWEVFVEHAITGKDELQFMMAGWDTATRFISRDLKREPLERTLRQLDKSSRQKNDLPAIIADKLRMWL